MNDETTTPAVEEVPKLMIALGVYAITGCILFICSILIADFVVPDHDWVADTISDLGAGRYEFIVDTGIYAFSASLIAIALLAAHVHLGGLGWSLGTVGFALAGLIVFLVGARNEYGDNDSEGVVIHVYLVYALGVLFAAAPALMSRGAGRAGPGYRRALIGLAVLWTVSAPIFFVLPTEIDGIYERYLGLVAMAVVVTFARLFIARGRKLG
ncbi:DUF998 domain-containing protein [Sulfitobacter sp. D35]|uniref:DUF998 domain-containing protein n=1 Tax=Sulfitobacter sp. D35 TaxID=3083252 RepID=UPI00296E9BFD|nr:DUF998 domain-containing protein [Sulfitobacter sp. D35]MDW4498785.1 DUF998 domain-containing protein [Sulfitobacter sp. D35]